nr:MAG TPA: hypothetical protein [Caudoviricetes sp.]
MSFKNHRSIDVIILKGHIGFAPMNINRCYSSL